MNVRQLRLVGGTARQALEREAAAAAAAWAADWGAGAVSVRTLPAGDQHPDGHVLWRRGWQAGGAVAWASWTAELASEVAGSMFATHVADAYASGPARVAPAVAQDAIDALIGSIAAVVLGPGPHVPCLPGQQPAAEWLPMSGALLLQVAVGGAELTWLLDDTAVQAWAGRSGVPKPVLPRLDAVDLRVALAPVPLALPVRLGGVDVNLAALLSVAPGDVIRLGVPLEQPLEVTTPDGRPLLAASLGRIGGQVAVELLANVSGT